ncbi:hypothetical protein [Streptomyces sp. NPDC056264]|uniref:hypothetical protein n=1 Tax=Streptomyces sp. NPDC056264 TaxID=3345767 RepID=UPI003AAA5778
MAHFTLHPPAGVELVAFFITARLAGQSDRSAFCEVLQRQLYAILGEEEPPVTEHTRDEQLLTAWERAAERCAAQGNRLIVLVDGLDEDRGVVAGPESYSIAALLPAEPPHGSRILIAGRPHPPVPDDVPRSHPIRNLVNAHALAVSEHAEAVRRDAEADLLRLLQPGTLGHELLGLITAAGGGLSSADLAHLAHTTPRMVERHLGTVTGRVFRTSKSAWQPVGQAPNTGEDVYLLGHEELQQTALSLMPATEISEFLQRLHAWADHYHSQNWPPNSPEYLLRGYPKILQETSDLRRLISLATSEHRHERLRQKSGTDLAALTEIESSFDLIAGINCTSSTALGSATRLAFHRDSLHERNRHLPNKLFSLWARLGMVERAANHALVQDSYGRKIGALLAVADTMREIGDTDYFLSLTSEAYDLTLSIPDPSDQAYHCAEIAHAYIRAKDLPIAARHAKEASVLIASIDPNEVENETHALISRAFARLGLWDRALNQTETIAGDDERALTVASIAIISARSGDLQRATEIAYGISNEMQRSRALAQIAKDFHKAELATQASKLIRDAIAVGRTIKNPIEQAHSLAATGGALVDTERLDWAAVVTDEAYNVALSAPADSHRTLALSTVARTFAKSRHFGHSAEAVNSIDDGSWRALTQAYIAEEIASSGDYEKAASVAEAIEDSQQRSRALSSVAKALSRAKRCDEALVLASSLGGKPRVEAMIEIATDITKLGDRDRGLQLADEITELSRSLSTNVADDPWALNDIAQALAESASPDDALPVIESMNKCVETPNLEPVMRSQIIDLAIEATAWTSRSENALAQVRLFETSHRKATALARISSIRTQSGDPSVARQIAGEAVATSRALSEPKARSTALAAAAQAAAEAGQKEHALNLAEEANKIVRELADLETRSLVLASTAQAIAEAGREESAVHLAYEAVEIGRSLTDFDVQAQVVTIAAKVLCRTGQFHSAREIVLSLTESDLRAEATFEVVQHLCETGELHLAEQLAVSLSSIDMQAKAQCAIALETDSVGKALVSALRICPWQDLAWFLAQVIPEELVHIYERLVSENR